MKSQKIKSMWLILSCLLVLLVVLVDHYRPTIDVIPGNRVLLWYNKNGINTERTYIILYSKK